MYLCSFRPCWSEEETEDLENYLRKEEVYALNTWEDIILPRAQAQDYGHSLDRELAMQFLRAFHFNGCDHQTEEEAQKV